MGPIPSSPWFHVPFLLSQPTARVRRVRRVQRIAAAVVLGLVGGWVGLALGGTVHHEVGPLTTSMRVHASWGGGTTVEIPPLGKLTLDTHSGPLGIEARLTGVDVDEARQIMEDPSLLQGMQVTAERDVQWALRMALLRALLAATVGATLLAALALRRVRTAAVGAGTATLAMAASFTIALNTWNPTALSEPRYSGLLTSAPTVVGSAEDIVSDFSVYGDQLARLVQNVSGLYTVTSQLPVLPEDDLVRVLHVSDLHLAPQAWDVIRTVSEQYDVDVVVDSGDITDHGSRAENRYLQEIRHIPAPYVWVRGNHDSLDTEAAMRKIPNAVVLDGRARNVAGLRFLGVGDPTFTPDKSLRATENAVASTADVLAGAAEQDGEVDVVVYHDPTVAGVFDGRASMVLSGHLHYREVSQGDDDTWLMVQGSTGGSGLRALEPEEGPAGIMLSVLYVERDTGELRAYDDIRLGGLGMASAQINRHVVEEAEPDTQFVAPEPADSE